MLGRLTKLRLFYTKDFPHDINISMIKNILIDLDDTILDFAKAERGAITNTFTLLDIEPTEELLKRYSEINDWHWKQLELQKMTRKEVMIGRFAMLFKEYGIDKSALDAQELYKQNLSRGHYFIPGALEFIKTLKQENYRLFIVSNGTSSIQHSRINSANITSYFENIFISEELGANKPSKEFFDQVFSKIHGITKEETIMIGDSLTSDIRGGENYQLTTIWFNPKHKENATLNTASPVHPDDEAATYTEMLNIIHNDN